MINKQMKNHWNKNLVKDLPDLKPISNPSQETRNINPFHNDSLDIPNMSVL